MNIQECIDLLAVSAEIIDGAPARGFLDLDTVRNTIQKTRRFLENAAPQYELGLILKDDLIASLKAKINVLKIVDSGQLLAPVENILDSDKFDFEQIKAIQTEIDKSLAKSFGTPEVSAGVSNPTNVNDYR
ncbi:MAG: hypothetical protein GX409_04875 [candidate division Zixibacteria bacterium]|nr:hypothetical protein [candidate division Zixibacteria bacterium]